MIGDEEAIVNLLVEWLHLRFDDEVFFVITPIAPRNSQGFIWVVGHSLSRHRDLITFEKLKRLVLVQEEVAL